MKKESKEKIVKQYIEKAGRAKAFCLINYKGLNVAESSELRQNLKKIKVDYMVIKNKLFKRAISEELYSKISNYIKGPTAVSFILDDDKLPVLIKNLIEFSKATKKLEIKSCLVGKELILTEKIREVATWQPKSTLYKEIILNLNSPILRLIDSLSFFVIDLIRTLDIYIARKEESK